ncbi:FGGY-family carbohydrate kinase [Paenibacillus dakarensis]|uniref:FGGY-family carbohydrate kinase n=1 Tax=Paenibacillus dakarensis TaxID=1527293 RepID=UPI0006D566C9|nr:FGGY-family carbohydrate kinase [Paenibacillus dakarensis]
MKYLVGCDIGTSGTKTIIMSTDGKLVSSDLQEYSVLTPKNLWAEQWPDVWIEAMEHSIRRSIQAGNIDPQEIAGVCISGLYGGSGIPLDENMKAVRPCLIWMDRRAQEEERWVKELVPMDRLEAITHNGTDPYYGYLKMLWIKHHEPDHWERTKLFLPPNAYAIYSLTGEIAIDYSSAGNIGGIFDMIERTWSQEMLEYLDIPLSKLPQRLVESSEIVGNVTTEASKRTGLMAGTPVIAGGVDCAVATLGMGVYEEGTYATTIGTSMCAAFVHESNDISERLIKFPYVKDGRRLNYSFGGGATAGALIKWFRDEFGKLELFNENNGGPNAYQSLDALAEPIPAGSDGLLVLPYFMGERSPVWDPNAKGVIFGLSIAHTQGHVYRAFLEAVAYSLKHSMVSTKNKIGDTILIAGGVSKSRVWKSILADVTGKNIICPKDDIEATLGDVILAGIGTNEVSWESVKEWQIFDEPVRPNPKNHSLYNRYFELYLKLYEDLKGNMESISKL